MITNKQRNDILERLHRDLAETITQWALNDYDSLLEFVEANGGYTELDDDTLLNCYEAQFGEAFDEGEQDCC